MANRQQKNSATHLKF